MPPTGISKFIGWLASAPPEPVSLFPISSSHVEPAWVGPTEPFRAGEHYCTLRLAALRLESGRKWFTSYLPLVATACEYVYDTGSRATPFVAGPSLVGAEPDKLPTLISLDNTRICDTYPYRGGDVSVSVTLSRVVSDARLERLVGVIEHASRALGAATAVAPYLAIAQIVADGVTDLADKGDAAPLLAGRIALNEDNGSFAPGYVLLSAGRLEPDEIWVRRREVLVGPTRDAATPLQADHVLLAVEQAHKRSDAEALPVVAEHWRRVDDFAGRPDPSSWDTAKSWLSVLAQDMYLSPDLTRGQAESMYADYVDRAVRRRDDARRLAHLGPADNDEERQTLRNIDHAVRAL